MMKSDKSLTAWFSTHSVFYKLIDTLSHKPYKIFYTGLIPKPVRRRLAEQAKLAQQNHIAGCWKQVVSLYLNNLIEEILVKPEKILTGRKIIWQYWGQGWDEEKLPETVRICRNSVQRYKGDYEIIYLDDNNLKEYVQFPDFVYEKRKNPDFRHVFFSDLLRLALLACYGGVWVDATILFTGTLPDTMSKLPFFVFQRDKNATEKEKWRKLNPDYFSWVHNHRVNSLNSLIFSQKNSAAVKILLQLMLWFWKTQNSIPHYFFFQILFDELKKENIIDEFEVIDDTLPHLLFARLHDDFEQSVLDSITARCHQHKLTYINSCVPNSFYDYLRKKYLQSCE